MLDDFSLEVLKFVSKKTQNGKPTTWYNVERAIHPTRFVMRKMAGVVLRELGEMGFLEKVDGTDPMTQWFITPLGEEYLKNLTDDNHS